MLLPRGRRTKRPAYRRPRQQQIDLLPWTLRTRPGAPQKTLWRTSMSWQRASRARRRPPRPRTSGCPLLQPRTAPASTPNSAHRTTSTPLTTGPLSNTGASPTCNKRSDTQLRTRKPIPTHEAELACQFKQFEPTAGVSVAPLCGQQRPPGALRGPSQPGPQPWQYPRSLCSHATCEQSGRLSAWVCCRQSRSRNAREPRAAPSRLTRQGPAHGCLQADDSSPPAQNCAHKVSA